jgi:hypothetical protein
VTDPTTPSAEQLRQDARALRHESNQSHEYGFAELEGSQWAGVLTRAAFALDAEAARLEREAADAPNSSESPKSSPTLAELDAAVAEARNALNEAVGKYKFSESTDEQIASWNVVFRLNDCIAAAEARGAARMGGWCVWRYEDYLYSTECGAGQEYHTEFCPTCGGRVRVEGADE